MQGRAPGVASGDMRAQGPANATDLKDGTLHGGIFERLGRALRARFLRWRGDESGAVGYLAAFAVLPLTLLLFYLVNSSEEIFEKNRTQDAADMIALAHASEAARSLNTISMNQVSMTQVFAAGVTSSSLIPIILAQDMMALQSGAMAAAWYAKTCNKNYKYLKSIPKIGAALYAAAFAACIAPLAAIETELMVNGINTTAILWKFDVYKAKDTASNAIEALNKKNQAIYDRFPEAVSAQAEQIAQAIKVTEIYFDNSCNGSPRATSCDDGDLHQGMDLPIEKNKRPAGYLRFCAGLHLGTGGFSLGSFGLPGLDTDIDLGGALINSSYAKRGFPMNKGPLTSGGNDEHPHLRDFVNRETRIGMLMEEYYHTLSTKNMFDGFMYGINTPKSIARGIEAGLELGDLANVDFQGDDNYEPIQEAIPAVGQKALDKVGGINWPREQTEEKNEYKSLVNLRVANMCAGDITSAVPGLNALSSFFSFATGALPQVNVYHPADEGITPTLQPGLDDFSDNYKVVSFAVRQRNSRWAPSVFENPVEGFFGYAQSIVHNPDEIGLYTQNWQGRLMHSTKFEDSGQTVVQRMQNDAPAEFDPLASRLDAVVGSGTWQRLVVR
jgi:hypothetical protein